jgi:hypothetical protein
MVYNVYVMRIYLEYQTKNSNSNLVLDEYFLNYDYLLFIIKNDINDNHCYFLTLLKSK